MINLLGGQQAGSVQQEAGSEDRSSAGRLLECVIYFWLSAVRAEWTLKLLDECNRWAEDYVSNLFPFCFLFIFLPLFTQCILSYFPPITASTILYQQPCYSSALNSSLIFPKKASSTTEITLNKQSPIAFVLQMNRLGSPHPPPGAWLDLNP